MRLIRFFNKSEMPGALYSAQAAVGNSFFDYLSARKRRIGIVFAPYKKRWAFYISYNVAQICIDERNHSVAKHCRRCVIIGGAVMPASHIKKTAAEIPYKGQSKQALYTLKIPRPALLARRFFGYYTGGIEQNYFGGVYSAVSGER